MPRLALAFGLVGALSLLVVDEGCSTTSAGAVTCALGAACSATQSCQGGIAGCTSNCQCRGGTWQAPCPADLPTTGSACTSEGAECGYTTATNACGADNCYCQGGAWRCEPTCAIRDAPVAVEDAAPEASGPVFCVDAGMVPNCADADIQASNYDQTCQTDSDCVLVGEGESCHPCSLAYGPYGAISHSDLARFEADVAKTPAGNLPVSCLPACTPSPLACCHSGKCNADSRCSVPPDAGPDAATDAAADACAPPIVCSGACVSGAHNVSHLADGCLVWQCCVPDDAGADAAGE